MDEWIDVEVVHVMPTRVWREQVRVAPGASAGDAIDASLLRASCPELCIDDAHVGVFGRRVSLQHPLQHGDRVEIYRDLELDPMQARRRRADRRSG